MNAGIVPHSTYGFTEYFTKDNKACNSECKTNDAQHRKQAAAQWGVRTANCSHRRSEVESSPSSLDSERGELPCGAIQRSKESPHLLCLWHYTNWFGYHEHSLQSSNRTTAVMSGIGITAPHPIISLLNCGRNTFYFRVVLLRGENSGENLAASAVMYSKTLGKHKISLKCLWRVFLHGRKGMSTGSPRCYNQSFVVALMAQALHHEAQTSL